MLHQRDLGGRFDHAAARRHGRGAHERGARHFLTHAVEDEEADALLHANIAMSRAAIAQYAGDDAIWRFVFLPDADVVREFDQLARPLLLETGRDPREFALLRDDDAEGTLAISPMHAGEIDET